MSSPSRSILWIALAIVAPNFLTEGNITNMMRQTSIAAIIAIGVLCTIIIAGIDLSVGSVVAFCGVLFAQLCCRTASTSALAVALALVAGLAIGVINALGHRQAGIPAFIVTLAGLQVYRGLALLVSGGMTVGGLPAGDQGLRPRRRSSALPNLFLDHAGRRRRRPLPAALSRAPAATCTRSARMPRPHGARASSPDA